MRRPPDHRAGSATRDNAWMDTDELDFIVVGDKVALGPLRRDLAADYARWMNQPDVRCGLNQMGIATPQSQEKWVEDNLERGAKSEPEVVEFTVYDRKDSAPVGTAGLLGILHAHGNAEFAIVSRRAPRPGPRHRGHPPRARLRVPRAARCATCCSRRWSGTPPGWRHTSARAFAASACAAARGSAAGSPPTSCSWTPSRRTSARRCCAEQSAGAEARDLGRRFSWLPALVASMSTTRGNGL